MEFFEVVKRRRSIRKYLATPVPDQVVKRALDAALLAPNSSNLQTWSFYWIKTGTVREQMIEACLRQNAAQTSKHLIVCVSNIKLWKKHRDYLIEEFKKVKTPKIVYDYYQKLTPVLYGYRFLCFLKWFIFNVIGMFRPISRRPYCTRDLQEISIKSAALACQNFMLSIAAQGFDTCPMEGFDEVRVKKILGLGRLERVVMVISVGQRDESKVWGEQIRVPKDWVLHER